MAALCERADDALRDAVAGIAGDGAVGSGREGDPSLTELRVTVMLEQFATPFVTRARVQLGQLRRARALAPARHGRVLTSAHVQLLASRCPRLAHLQVTSHSAAPSSAGVADAALLALARTCTQLSVLDVGLCKRVTVAGLVAVARACPLLTELNAGWCGTVTDDVLRALARGCPRLEALNVGDSGDVTDAGVEAVAAACPALRHLHFSWCRQLSRGCAVRGISSIGRRG